MSHRIVRRLATGGMAEVLLARDARGRVVALKRVLPHLADVAHVAERLRAEARAAAALDHPGIVKVLEVIEGDPPALVLEHVAGIDVRTLRARAGPLPREAVVAVVAQAAAALAHAHARGVVHRDVRPANLLVRWDGGVKLADFGIAAVGRDADPAVDLAALRRLARRLSDPHDTYPPTSQVSSGGLEAPPSLRKSAPSLQAAPPPSSVTATAEGGFPDQRSDRRSAASLALALTVWLDTRGIRDARAPLAALLSVLFSDEERREGVTLDDDEDEPTPTLLGEPTRPAR